MFGATLMWFTFFFSLILLLWSLMYEIQYTDTGSATKPEIEIKIWNFMIYHNFYLVELLTKV